MMNKRLSSIKAIMVSIGLAGILLTITMLQTSEAKTNLLPPQVQETIRKGFTMIGIQMSALGPKKDQIFIHGEGVMIPLDQFVFYKENHKLLQSLQPEGTGTMSDQELIKNLIIDEISVLYAQEQGIGVSQEEVDRVIQFQRSVLNKADDPHGKVIQELMDNRIKISGLTEDQFWNSQYIKEVYRKALLRGKLANRLVELGTIKDVRNFSEFMQQQYEQKKEKITVEYALLGTKQPSSP